MLTAALCLAAFVAGVTGAWSPCGFSMVGSLGSPGGRRTTLAACAAFVPGALVGGALTFGGFALVGAAVGGGAMALALAALLAAVAAVAELGGVRIAPQIRRQVPEHWRRVLPLPLAALGYGVLLGLGFTTFVLTFAVPALAGIALAVGDPLVGLAVGLAFGAGRAMPVVALAPFAEAPLGIRAMELMAERPAILRGFRAADAIALAACAVTLGTASAAEAATRAFLSPATDPSTAGGELAWQVPGGGAIVRGGAGDRAVDGARPALSGRFVATLVGGDIRVAERATGATVVTVAAPGADALAVSDTWLVFRRPGDELVAVPLTGGEPRPVASAAAPAQLGRPSLDGDRVVFHVASTSSSRILEINLSSGQRTTLRTAPRASAVTNPSLAGEELLWVEASPWSQTLRLGRRGSTRSSVLLKIAPAIQADKGYTTKHGPHRRTRRPRRPRPEGPPGTTTTLWTTALAPDAAYVTRLRARDGTTRAAILRVAR